MYIICHKLGSITPNNSSLNNITRSLESHDIVTYIAYHVKVIYDHGYPLFFRMPILIQ